MKDDLFMFSYGGQKGLQHAIDKIVSLRGKDLYEINRSCTCFDVQWVKMRFGWKLTFFFFLQCGGQIGLPQC